MVDMELDIVVSRNGQLQWSIIGSDMPSALGLVTYFNYNREDWRLEHRMHHIVVQWSTIMASSLANSANASGDIFFATQSDSALQQRGMSQNEWFGAIECNRL